MAFLNPVIARIWGAWCLTVFIVTSLLVWLVLTSLNHYADPKRTRFFQLVSRGWISTYFFLSGVRFSMKGCKVFENHPTSIVLCNHRSVVDILVMTPFIPRVNKSIGKDSFMKIPFFRKIYGSATILVNRSSMMSRSKSMWAMKQALKEGFTICIYPEGKRNKTNFPLLKFQKGAFLLALEMQQPIIPSVLINTDKAVSTRKFFWALPTHVKLYFLNPVFPNESDTVDALSKRVRHIMQEAYLHYSS